MSCLSISNGPIKFVSVGLDRLPVGVMGEYQLLMTAVIRILLDGHHMEHEWQMRESQRMEKKTD